MTINVVIKNDDASPGSVRVVRLNKDTGSPENYPVILYPAQAVTIAVWDTTKIVIEELG